MYLCSCIPFEPHVTPFSRVTWGRHAATRQPGAASPRHPTLKTPPPTPPRRQPKKQEWFYYYLRVIVQPLAGTAIVHIRWSRPSTLFSHVPHLPFSQLNLMGALAARTTSFRR